MTHPLITPKNIPIIRDELNKEGRSVTVTQPMSFGPAWELCKMGAKICRLADPESFIYAQRFPTGEYPIAIISVNGMLQPGWVASRDDLFAEDYYLYPIKNPDGSIQG
jgi:hypothetical protein